MSQGHAQRLPYNRPSGSRPLNVAPYSSSDPMQSSYQSYDGMQSLTMPFYQSNVESEGKPTGSIHPFRSHSYQVPSKQIYSSPGRYSGYYNTMAYPLGQYYARLSQMAPYFPNFKSERMSMGKPYYGKISGSGNPYHQVQGSYQATPFALSSQTSKARMNPYNHNTNMAPGQVPSMGSAATQSGNRFPSILSPTAPYYGRRQMSQVKPAFSPSQYQHSTGYTVPVVERQHHYGLNTQNNIQEPSRNYQIQEHYPGAHTGTKPSFSKVFVNV